MKRLLSFLAFLWKVRGTGPSFRQSLPVIFDEIDQAVPPVVGKASGHEVELLIARAVANSTGSPTTQRQLNAIIDLYSPVVAATKAFARGE